MLDTMTEKKRRVYERAAQKLDHIVWENGLVRSEGPGHTRGAQCPTVHSGRMTAEMYVLGRVTGRLSEEEGLSILKALAALQVLDDAGNPDALPKIDPGSQYGAFRWYLEEDRIWDTNAAFFICMPLLIHRLTVPACFSKAEIALMDDMLALAGHWFSHECDHAIYYYSNKILSDGAALSAIAHLTGSAAYLEKAQSFFRRWLDYTDRRGWGWGENTSLGYNDVILPALRVAALTIGDRDIAQRLEGLIESQKRFFRFYDGHEVCPSIRTYNYEGLSERPSHVYNLSGVPGSGLDALCNASDLFCMFAEDMYLTDDELKPEAQPVPRFQRTRVFDEACSSSWYALHGGIGSLNVFPVISGIDRNATWGLGWQSMPVSFVVYGEQTGYLRFYVNDGEAVRAHPKRNYLSPRLFSETMLPRVTTCSAQDGAMVVSVRAIDRLHNRAEEIADEYYISRFKGRVCTYQAIGRTFKVLRYDHATVIISALDGMTYGSERGAGVIEEIFGEDNLLTLRQVLYRGEEKTLLADRLETAWLTIYKDEAMSDEAIEGYLSSLDISDESYTDGEEPRDEWALIRRISVSDGTNHAVLVCDPYRFKGGAH